MNKKILIAAIAAVAGAGVAAYFLKRRNMHANNNHVENMSANANTHHITDVFSRAKSHVTAHNGA